MCIILAIFTHKRRCISPDHQIFRTFSTAQGLIFYFLQTTFGQKSLKWSRIVQNTKKLPYNSSVLGFTPCVLSSHLSWEETSARKLIKHAQFKKLAAVFFHLPLLVITVWLLNVFSDYADNSCTSFPCLVRNWLFPELEI